MSETLYFWNDTQKLTLIIEPLDIVEPPVPDPLEIPTKIQLQWLVDEIPPLPIIPEIPSNINLNHMMNGNH